MSTTTTTRHALGEHESKPRLAEHASAIRDDLRQVKSDVAAAASTAGDVVQHEAERVMDIARAGSERAGELHESVCNTVRRHPTASLVATLGVGVLIGRLIAGR